MILEKTEWFCYSQSRVIPHTMFLTTVVSNIIVNDKDSWIYISITLYYHLIDFDTETSKRIFKFITLFWSFENASLIIHDPYHLWKKMVSAKIGAFHSSIKNCIPFYFPLKKCKMFPNTVKLKTSQYQHEKKKEWFRMLEPRTSFYKDYMN